jgi:uncharacterized protein (TIGR03437 family)
MRTSIYVLAVLAGAGILVSPAQSAEPDALAITSEILANHVPFGGIIDPVFDSPTGTTIVGYSDCGDSALWTGAFIAAESFHYAVNQSPDALTNVKNALAGLKALDDVTGNNRLARCMFPSNWQFANYVAMSQSSNTVNQSPPWEWVDNTSRDEIVGAMFGLAAAYDLVNDPDVKSSVGALAARIAGYVSGHNWTPNNDIGNTFLDRPEELQNLLDVTRHVDPGNGISGPFFNPIPFDAGVLVDVNGGNGSYFKFNLDYMTFYTLVRYNPNSSQYLGAYVDVRNYTANHQNPFFDIIDHALRGANHFDTEIRPLLDQWLLRPKRDLYIDDSKIVKTCSSTEACNPIPVPLRPTTDFLWQRDPFQLTGGGYDTTETPGIDYILPYWMGRYYGVIPAVALQSSAAIQYNLPPDSIASMYATNLASSTQSASAQPLPTILAGTSVTVTDSAGAQRPAPLIYASPTQINFVVPDGTAAGLATFTVNNGGATQTGTANIQAVAPTLFSANGSGMGVAAATAVVSQGGASNQQSPVTVFQCGDGGCSAVPIALGANATVTVSFYGTGIRNAANVSVTINGVSAPVTYYGPAPGFTGLDQVNVTLDPSLSGSGNVVVVLTADGQATDPNTNVVMISIQ